MRTEIKLQNVGILKKYEKIIVTGPPRSGTTIAALIIAKELNYKFIDESWYDANNPQKFMFFFGLPRKMVIHTTAFLKDIHVLKNFPKVLVERKIEDILESFDNTKNFSMKIATSHGLMTQVGEQEQEILLKHYGKKSGCIPKIIYKHFKKYNKDYYFIKYDSLREHEKFVPKHIRREKFKHIKQVDADDVYYLKNRKGVMVL